jgi:serine/threonine protein kinase
LATLAHDHIVRVFEVSEDRGVPFLAMEFLKGEPLDERLKREPLLPLAEVLRIGQELAEALGAAHEHGLIHRDIKPANIWLEAPRNRVKILDFGLALATSQDAGMTQQGASVGTPAYAAPEQALGDTADARSDLFSLGVVLYRLCSGQLPFQGINALTTMLAVATQQPLSPTRINPEVPRALSDLVMHLLEKDRSQRPASAGEVVAELQALEKSLDRASVTETPRLRRAPESATFDFVVVTEKAPRGRSAAKKRPNVAASRARPARKHSSKSLFLLILGGVGLLAVVIVGVVVFR